VHAIPLAPATLSTTAAAINSGFNPTCLIVGPPDPRNPLSHRPHFRSRLARRQEYHKHHISPACERHNIEPVRPCMKRHPGPARIASRSPIRGASMPLVQYFRKPTTRGRIHLSKLAGQRKNVRRKYQSAAPCRFCSPIGIRIGSRWRTFRRPCASFFSFLFIGLVAEVRRKPRNPGASRAAGQAPGPPTLRNTSN